jgi:hypothetical protein
LAKLSVAGTERTPATCHAVITGAARDLPIANSKNKKCPLPPPGEPRFSVYIAEQNYSNLSCWNADVSALLPNRARRLQ